MNLQLRPFFSFLLLFFLCANLWSAGAFHVSAIDPLLTKIVQANLEENYAKAFQSVLLLKKKFPAHPAGKIFEAITQLTRFDDLGTPYDLKNASRILNDLTDKLESDDFFGDLPKEERSFWEGLSLLQSGYASRLKGENLNAALKTRKGANILKELKNNADAQALHGIYGYYLGVLLKGLSWLPFVEDTRSESILALKTGLKNSRYFDPLYRTTLCWIAFDQHNYKQAETLASNLLKKHPGNRLFRQIKADMIYRQGRVQEAENIYASVFTEYQKLAPGSPRYLSSAGNLFVFYKQLGLNKEAKEQANNYNNPKYRANLKELPESFRKRIEAAGVLQY